MRNFKWCFTLMCGGMIKSLLLFSHVAAYVLSESGPEEKCKGRCCTNFYEDQYGLCRECPLGTYGLNCTGSCIPQFYGRLCRSRCNCPSHLCDAKVGCVNYDSDNTWKHVAFALIGSVATMVVIGMLFLMQSWFTKGSTDTSSKNVFTSNENEIENTDEEHLYERRRSLPSTDNDINHTDLRRAALDEDKPGPNSEIVTADTAKSMAVLDLSIGEEDDSSDENESEDEGYGQLSGHGMHNDLSFYRTNTDKTIHNRPVSDDKIQLAISKVSRSKIEIRNEASRGLYEKTIVRPSLINETFEEFVETSKVAQNQNVPKNENEQLDMTTKNSKSPTKSNGIEHSLQQNTRPYSLAKLNLTSDPMQDKNPVAEVVYEDDVNKSPKMMV